MLFENNIFWSEIGPGFGEPSHTPLATKNSEESSYRILLLFLQDHAT